MAFSYAPSNNGQQALSFGSGLNYGSAQAQQRSQGAQPTQLEYGNQFPAQQQQQSGMDPQQMMKLYQQYQAMNGGSASGTGNGLSGLLSSNGGSAGLGGSGLIGSAGGATSAAANGGASYGLGGSLVGGTGTVGGSTFAAGAGSGAAGGAALGGGSATGAAGGAGAGAAGGGMGAAAAAAGPWAALAAIIMLNEEDSRKKGLRAENRGERTKDQLTGKVATQDIEGKWGPMLDRWTGGLGTKSGFIGDSKGASQIASGRIGPGLNSLWNEGSLKKIRNIF